MLYPKNEQCFQFSEAFSPDASMSIQIIQNVIRNYESSTVINCSATWLGAKQSSLKSGTKP